MDKDGKLVVANNGFSSKSVSCDGAEVNVLYGGELTLVSGYSIEFFSRRDKQPVIMTLTKSFSEFVDEAITEEQICHLRQTMEIGQDDLAKNIANEISSLNTQQSNPNNNEFGAFILRLNDGRYVRVNTLTVGSTGAVRLSDMMAGAREEYGANIDASNIVAIVHLHPRDAGPGFENVSNIGELGALDYGNTMPSHPNIQSGANDWGSAQTFLLNNGRSSVTDVSHYILGPDGILRQYNYSDGHPSEQTEQYQLINNAENNANGDCNETND